jgi:hypothetical protein
MMKMYSYVQLFTKRVKTYIFIRLQVFNLNIKEIYLWRDKAET